jgi:formate/nitrite transporter FocA (FNT family)
LTIPRSFALLAGAVVTLMTWMQHGFESSGVKLVSAITTGFLLAASSMNHAAVTSLLIFCGLHTGMTPCGYLAWAQTAGWAILGNMVGGVALITLLCLLQVPRQVQQHRDDPLSSPAAVGPLDGC